MSVQILIGDCRVRLAELPDASVDSVVTDPPYELGFMGKSWDSTGVANDDSMWAEVLRVLKPGGHLVAFSGTRTYHRMAVAIEDAGFEIRDQLAWCYGSGFPKSLDVSKAIDKRGGNPNLAHEIGAAIKAARESRGVSASDADKRFCGGSTNWSWFEGRKGDCRPPTPDTFAAIVAEWPELAPLAFKVAAAEREAIAKSANGIAGGTGKHAGSDDSYGFKGEFDITVPATEAAQQWQGWGTALKPSWEPICLARRPLIGSVAQNVLTHGTGALNIDGTRIQADDGEDRSRPPRTPNEILGGGKGTNLTASEHNSLGRWPANLCHDGSEEVLAGFPEVHGAGAARDGSSRPARREIDTRNVPNAPITNTADMHRFGDSGSAARFFYCAKSSSEERGEGNTHPTVKPIALMRWLVRLVTPKGGTVLDPFSGSGSTLIAADAEQFDAIGCELSPEYAAIAERRIKNAAGMFADVRIAA